MWNVIQFCIVQPAHNDVSEYLFWLVGRTLEQHTVGERARGAGTSSLPARRQRSTYWQRTSAHPGPDGASLNCKVHSRSICIRTAGCKLHSSVLIEMPHRIERRRIEPPSREKGEKTRKCMVPRTGSPMNTNHPITKWRASMHQMTGICG